MKRLGVLGGGYNISVYEIGFNEWSDRVTKNDTYMYKVGNDLWFHDQKVGRFKDGTYEVIGHTVNEEEIDNLIRQYSLKEEDKMGETTYTYAETEPQVEEKPVNESVDAGTAIDQFMKGWKDNIDKEIAVMKVQINDMEREMLSAAN